MSSAEPLLELARRFGVVIVAVVLGESEMVEYARSNSFPAKLIGALIVITPLKSLRTGEVVLAPFQPAYISSAPLPVFVMLPVTLMCWCEMRRSVFVAARSGEAASTSMPQLPTGEHWDPDVVI